MIETASALNLAAYLLLKSEQPPQQQHKKDLASANASLSSHPVLSHLRRLHKLSTQLEAVLDKVPGLSDQLDKLVQAAALMKGDATINDESRTDGSDDEAPEAKGRSDDIDANSFDDHEEDVGSVSSGKEAAKVAPLRIGAVSSASSSSNSDSEDEEVRRKRVLDEARFALRPKEVEDGAVAIPWKRRPAPDFGEDVPEAQESIGKKKAFAAALNSIQQRAAKSTIKRSRMAEDLDDFLDREDDFMAGDDDHEHFGGHGTGKARDRGNDEEYDEAIDPELDEDGEGDFYSLVARKNQSRKEARKALYKVAPKYPRIEQEVDGERAVSRQILKNRGLVPHKNRLNRNPRVKKREQYRKALIRRKGAVREVRTDEGHIYGGEQTGIKTGLSRSRKLV
jgi:U3 small nucleolar RNA-associated protein 3